MIKFLRIIRQRLPIENKFTKYLIYAIGEVLIIVIGVLVAVQINNWNEKRKERIQETTILKQLLTDFKSNLEQLDEKIAIRKSEINSAVQLLYYIDFPKDRNKDSIDKHITETLTYTTFDPIINDLVRSGNLRIIKNDSIKQLLSLWTSEIVQVSEEELNWQRYRDELYRPFLIKHYQLRTMLTEAWKRNYFKRFLIDKKQQSIIETGNSKHSEDFHKLLNHPDFEDHIMTCIQINRVTNLQSEILRKRIGEILKLLKNEIEQ